MNVNGIKTALLGSGFLVLVGPPLVNAALSLFGCSGDNPLTKDVVEVATCTGGSLFNVPEAFRTVVGSIAITGALALTAWFKGGTVAQNLLNKSVPVVPVEQAKPGVVTELQVQTPHPK